MKAKRNKTLRIWAGVGGVGRGREPAPCPEGRDGENHGGFHGKRINHWKEGRGLRPLLFLAPGACLEKLPLLFFAPVCYDIFARHFFQQVIP